LGWPALGMRVFRGCWHVENQRLSRCTGVQGRGTAIHCDPIPGYHAGAVDGMGGGIEGERLPSGSAAVYLQAVRPCRELKMTGQIGSKMQEQGVRIDSPPYSPKTAVERSQDACSSRGGGGSCGQADPGISFFCGR